MSAPIDASASAGRAAVLGAAVLTLACIAMLLAEGASRAPQLDDAYISYRYADNLAGGRGLVYNPGERVEGITNLGWTLLVAAGIAAGQHAPDTGHVLGLASAALGLGLACIYAWGALPRRRAALAALAPVLVLAWGPYALWATSGMETLFFTAAVTAALLSDARDRPGWAAVAAGVATLIRPEGGLVAAAVFAPRLVGSPRGARFWAPILGYVLVVAALTAFRLAYYGSPVPNTFYAKVGGVPIERGIRYAAGFLRDGPGFLVIPALYAAVRDPRLRAGGAFLVLLVLYVVAVGGDAFPNSRFLVPAIPCLAVLAVCGAARALDGGTVPGFAAFALLAAALVWQVAGPPPFRADKRAERFRSVHTTRATLEHMGHTRARVLRERGAGSGRVVGAAIGSVGYYSDIHLVDVYGLVSPEIARSRAEPVAGTHAIPGHQRSNADFVFALRPDYLLVPEVGHPSSVHIPATRAIWEHAELARSYVWDSEVWGYRRRVPDAPPAADPERRDP